MNDNLREFLTQYNRVQLHTTNSEKICTVFRNNLKKDTFVNFKKYWKFNIHKTSQIFTLSQDKNKKEV